MHEKYLRQAWQSALKVVKLEIILSRDDHGKNSKRGGLLYSVDYYSEDKVYVPWRWQCSFERRDPCAFKRSMASFKL
jgi:hypothetical protein